MGFARKAARKNVEHKSRAQVAGEAARNKALTNANTAAALLARARPLMEQDLRQQVIEYEFLLNMLALHDIYGFELEQCMKLYRRTLEHNIALIESKCKTPVDMLVKTVNDEFKCDIRKVMAAINKEVEEKE